MDIIITKSHRRSIAVSVSRDGIVIVKAPRPMPKFLIDRFIQEHREWIEKTQERAKKSSPQKKRMYQDGEIFLYLGREYVFRIGNYTAISIHENDLLFPKALLFRAEKELTSWYIKKAKELITERVSWYGKELGTSYKGTLTFSDTRSQWGRCTQDNRLQFNWRLIMAPIVTINYVVVHELVHTMEKNHSQSFWRKVRAYNPSYRQQIKWLKENGERLHA